MKPTAVKRSADPNRRSCDSPSSRWQWWRRPWRRGRRRRDRLCSKRDPSARPAGHSSEEPEQIRTFQLEPGSLDLRFRSAEFYFYNLEHKKNKISLKLSDWDVWRSVGKLWDLLKQRSFKTLRRIRLYIRYKHQEPNRTGPLDGPEWSDNLFLWPEKLQQGSDRHWHGGKDPIPK